MDDEKIRAAIDSFEEEDFMASKDSIKDEFISTRDSLLKDKLGLKNDINPTSSDEDED